AAYVPQEGQPGFGYMPSGNSILNYLAYAIHYPSMVPRLVTASPPSRSTAGGTNVTIRGLNLGVDSTVTFGGVAAAGVIRDDATTLHATAPAHAAGFVDLGVSTGGNSLTLPNAFSFGPGAVGALGPVVRADLA